VAFISGVDIGGTFTDSIVVDDGGRIFPGKAPTTPDDRSKGFFDSLASAAEAAGISLDELLAGTDRLLHGTTVATNAMVERKGATVGLITTRGHRDVMLMMRGTGRVTGVPIERMLDLPSTDKPEPLVPRARIREVDERVDYSGEVIVPLDEGQVRDAVRDLLDLGVDAICVSFLWSFLMPDHEDRVAETVREMAPGVFVTAAHSLVSKWGEYERTAGAVINSFVGPATRRYLGAIGERLEEAAYSHPFLIMQSTGGLAPVADCERAPLLTIGSGPVGGLEGVRFLADELGMPNVIAADMGGTTFDVGLIVDGEPIKSATAEIGQYQYSLPIVEVQSIGAGGGSIAWIDEFSGGLKVGPQSAGADPGPACYGRGGREATITDANVVLGYLNPTHLLGGGLSLDRDAAHQAVAGIGGKLEMSTEEAAAGIATIGEFQMADLLRRMTVQKGLDPRDFVLFAYGGAGALHAGVIARELGIGKVVVPLGEAAGAWSALGIAASNVVRIFERTHVMYEPFDHQLLQDGFAALEAEATGDFKAQGFTGEEVELRRFAAMQYGSQVHQVEVAIPDGELDAEAMPKLIAAFEERYERLFGKGAGFRQAGVQIIDLRLEAVGITPKPTLAQRPEDGVTPDPEERRLVYWPGEKEQQETPVYSGADLDSGVSLTGPAIIDQDFTTVVVHPGQTASVDSYGNIIIEIG
jgi:N-methylhydantoinase A